MRSHAVVVSLLVFLSGCSSITEYTFDRTAARVQSIAVAPTEHDEEMLLRFRQDQYESVDILTPIPVARLFTFVAEENREAKFAREVGEDTGTYARHLQQQLRRVLDQEGFKTANASLDNDEELSRDRNGLLKKIPASAFGEADALLESSSAIGFTAAGRGKPFKPTLWLTVRLTDSSGSVRLFDQIQLNPEDGREQGLILYPTDTTHVFENQEALADDERRGAALNYAISRVISEFGYLFQSHAISLESQDATQVKTAAASMKEKNIGEAFDLRCDSPLAERRAELIPRDELIRPKLSDTLSCRWATAAPTDSQLLRIPASKRPLEIEVATRLDADGTTAAHVATLDHMFRPTQWVPFRNFRERRGYLVSRFFVAPSNKKRYLLVGGADSAVNNTLERTFAPVSTSLLNFAGLVTARELDEEFRFVPEGDLRVRIRESKTRKITILD